MLSLAFNATGHKAQEMCPHCDWHFDSQACCDEVSHNVGVVCPRCKGIFMSSVVPPLPPPQR